MYRQNSIKALFPEHFETYFKNVIKDYEKIRELRIRRNGPVQIIREDRPVYLTKAGCYSDFSQDGLRLTETEFMDLFSHICRHSIYAFEQELSKGYITVEGGHRVGVIGQTVWNGKQVTGMQYFTAMNIRFAHEIKGVADKVLPYLYQENELKSTLLVSLPGCGKTTLLRELVRKISNGSREHSAQNVSLIDERSEIASCYLGMAQNDVGMHTDILDACPKAEGMLMVLRSMSPQIIAVDELGGEEDYKAIQQAFYLGCRLLATIHGTDYDSIKRNPYLQDNLGAGGFERLIFLKGRAGKEQVIKICNEKGEVLELC